jgi:outer membrane biosynthesis protein TonB
MENSANVLRVALVISIFGHVLLMAFSARDLRPTSHGEVMTVDLVPANEAPPAAAEPKTEAAAEPKTEAAAQSAAQKPEPKTEKPQAQPNATPPSPKPTTKTAETKSPESKPPQTKTAQPQPDPAAQLTKWAEQRVPTPSDPTAVPAPAESAPAPGPGPMGQGREVAPNMTRLAATLGLPVDVMSGTSAEAMSKFTEGVKEFKAQVRKCFKLPAGVSPNEPFQMIIRVSLRPDGALNGPPEHIGGKFAPLGPALRDRALEAVRQCAPYRMPTEHYEQWKVLDIDFSPDQMMGS